MNSRFIIGMSMVGVVGFAYTSEDVYAQTANYVSVNSNETENRAGDGAEGQDAIAVGPKASGKGDRVVVVGSAASAIADNSVAIGNGAEANIDSAVSIGSGAGQNATGDQSNTGAVYIGLGAGSDSSGYWNVYIGSQNAGSDSTGDMNVAIGQASFFNGNGSNNSLYGSYAGNNSTGSYNAYSGFYAGGLSEGSYNSSYGTYAGAQSLGLYNAYSGFYAGGVSEGSYNSSYGSNAGFQSLGSYNAYSGYSAGAVSQGSYNTAFGQLSGYGSVGNGNVFSGSYAGFSLSGDGNIAMGQAAGTIGATVDSNGNLTAPTAFIEASNTISIGSQAAATTNESVALGAGAVATTENSVALGAGSTTADAVSTAGVTIRGRYYDFAGDTAQGTVSVGSDGAERTVTNVAAGRLSSDSTDAVNGSQLHATNQAVEVLETDVGNISNIVAQIDDSAVKYDLDASGNKTNKVTLLGSDPNAPVVVSNVAVGVDETDAVNLGQLRESVASTKSYTDEQIVQVSSQGREYTDAVAITTLNSAQEYTDHRLGELSHHIDDVSKEARQAAAVGLAAASLRFDDRPGKISAAMGGGYWRNEGAYAFGLGYTSETSRIRANASATTSGGHWGANAGLSFTLN